MLAWLAVFCLAWACTRQESHPSSSYSRWPRPLTVLPVSSLSVQHTTAQKVSEGKVIPPRVQWLWLAGTYILTCLAAAFVVGAAPFLPLSPEWAITSCIP